MKKNSRWFFAIVSLLAYTDVLAQSLVGTDLQMDRQRLSHKMQKLIQDDMEALAALPIEAARGSDFEKAFQGRNASDLLSYLNERLRYVGFDPDSSHDRSFYGVNFSMSWLEYIFKRDYLGHPNARIDREKFENQIIPIESPRAGFFALGGAYNERDSNLIDRLDTWIHEARHSDCPHLPIGQDFKFYGGSHYNEMSQEALRCTQIHTYCPKGHVLSGELACDSHTWGAYTFGYVFSHSVYKYCARCSEKERQEALAVANDDFSRLSAEVQDRTLKGTLENPVLSSLP